MAIEELKYELGKQTGQTAVGVFLGGCTSDIGAVDPVYVNIGFAPSKLTLFLASTTTAIAAPGARQEWNRAMYMQEEDSTYTGAVRGSTKYANDDYFCIEISTAGVPSKIDCVFPTSTQDAVGSTAWQESTSKTGIYVTTTETRGFWVGGANALTLATSSDNAKRSIVYCAEA
jgi:hypothetical protein